MIVLTDHTTLKHQMEKKESRLIRWIMLLQVFDCEIKDKKVSKSPIADHLSRLVTNNVSESPISNCFPDEQLFRAQVESWFADIVNYLVTGKCLGVE